MEGFLGTIWWSLLVTGVGFAAGVFLADKVKALLRK